MFDHLKNGGKRKKKRHEDDDTVESTFVHVLPGPFQHSRCSFFFVHIPVGFSGLQSNTNIDVNHILPFYLCLKILHKFNLDFFFFHVNERIMRTGAMERKREIERVKIICARRRR